MVTPHEQKMSEMVFALEQLPLVLNIEHLGKLTGLSKLKLYSLLQEAVYNRIFPVRQIGKKYFIPRDAFLTWLLCQEKNFYKESSQ